MITAKEAQEIFENSGVEEKAKEVLPNIEKLIKQEAGNSRRGCMYEVPSGMSGPVQTKVIQLLKGLGYTANNTASYFHIYW